MKKKFFALLMAIMFLLCETAFAQVSESDFSEIEENLPVLYSLITECENRGIDTSYERISYETLADFVKFGVVDIEMGDTDRAQYVLDVLNELYADATTKLNNYLSNAEEPKEVYRYSTAGGAEISGSDIVDKNGNPLFLNGYGHFGMAAQDIDRMQYFGANFVAMEIDPDNVVGSPGRIDGWSVFKNGGVDATVRIVEGGYTDGGSALEIVNNSAAANGVVVTVEKVIHVKPSTTYQLCFKSKAINGCSAYFSLNGWNNDYTNIRSADGSWQNNSKSYTTGASQTSLRLMIACNNKTQPLLLDDFVLSEGASGENILYNGDFEIPKTTSEHFSAGGASLAEGVGRYLSDAEQNDVKIDLLISPHYLSRDLQSTYPEMYAINSGFGYDMKNALVREFFDLYIRKIIETVGDSPALNSICLVNEPRVNTRTAGVHGLFQSYLKKEYNNDLNLLNEIYNTEYQSFDDILIPGEDTYDAIYRDWVFFNDEYYADFYGYLAECVKKYSDIPVHCKMMSVFNNLDYCNFGADPELFAEFCDYNGNDCYGFYDGLTGYAMNSKHMWYDFLKSIKDVPILNSEDHIIEDRNTNYALNHATQVAADIWQGAIHGRDATAVWLWERGTSKTSDDYGNIRYRPDAIVKVGETNLDLNRNADKIVALQDAKPTVSILYSKNSSIYSGRTYTSGMRNSYKAALMTGSNPDFITEKQLESQKRPKGDILIVPNATNISAAALAQIRKYQNKGGKVIAVGSNCLLRDEHNLLHGSAFTFDFSSPGNDISEIRNYIINNTDNVFVPLRDGALVEDIDVRATVFDNCKLVNLCNLSWAYSVKYVSVDGEVTDIITGNTYKDLVPLEPLKPVLLQLKEKTVTVNVDKNNSGVDVAITNNTLKDVTMEMSIVTEHESGKSSSSAFVKKFIEAENTAYLKYGVGDCNDFSVSLTGNCVDSDGKNVDIYINNR